MPVAPSTLLSDDDLYLFNEGTHRRLYERLGAHPRTIDGARGVNFAVWAPNARRLSVIGDFNGWRDDAHPLESRGGSGIWEGFIAGLSPGERYKYRIVSLRDGYTVDKADPFAFFAEVPPATASRVWELDYEWSDGDWMQRRAAGDSHREPMSIYEVHLGSWRRGNGGERLLGYRELAHTLAEYVASMGFTHIELLPVMEHPFYGSWGYQTTGYFAPTSRYGTPQDLMFLIDTLHQNGVGVILDWVPSHFPSDEHGLVYFDGTHLYEHADPRRGFHPDWKSYIFNYGRHEVQSFLVSSALFWLDRYHVDGLRVDAVASMLYLDYSRESGQWIPNVHGGRENLEAIDFLRRLNEAAYGEHPGIDMIAEESTAWPMVSRPSHLGGLGFGMKWDMGWMHDTLRYLAHEPVHRKYHHNELSFRMVYAFNENFVLPLSHDEVVYGKGSLLGRMPGDDWQRRANLRLLLGYMYTQPGKKLLFMGGEIGQEREWNHDESLDWHVLEGDSHRGLQAWVRDLNVCYRTRPALHRLDFAGEGFAWIDCNDAERSTLAFLRRNDEPEQVLLVACNFTPVPCHNHRLGVPHSGEWREILNSDAGAYGGSGQGNLGTVSSTPVSAQGHPHSIVLTLPPLGMVVLEWTGSEGSLD
jgi:1,4-alpha-glucan branching enzyme